LARPWQHGAEIDAVAFSPDGKTFLVRGKSTSWIWPLPTPVSGDVERLVLWTQVITGLELDDNGLVRVLDAASWAERRERLQKLGGPPGKQSTYGEPGA
jgi:hypothetical protein